MSILSRFKMARDQFETIQRNRRSRRIASLQAKEEVLKQEVKVETLKAEKAKQRKKRKSMSSFGSGVKNAIKSKDRPYWLKEKADSRPYWLK